MKSYICKMIATLLTVCMVLSILPMSVFAADTPQPAEEGTMLNESDNTTQIYLSDLNWDNKDFATYTVGYGSIGLNAGVSGEGNISLNGTVYSKGIAAHASSQINLNIEDYHPSLFTADIGINDSVGNEGNANFVVRIDGKEAFRQNGLTGANNAVSIRVEIPENAKTLTLITEEGTSKSFDHTVWANPILVVPADALDNISQKQIQKVVDMIDALGEITAQSTAAVSAARSAYNRLTELQQEKVLNLPLLEAAEEKLIDLGATVEERQTPLMGWSSWNNYRVNISEDLFISQIDALVETGLVDAGYTYFNIDDGYQRGRSTQTGLVVANPDKFPHGMKYIADYAHKNGMKAGIYSDCGYNTCASIYDGQGADGTGYGLGVGLYDHWYEDLYQYLVTWDYDFIKVDWCGGDTFTPNRLDKQTEYTRISGYIDQMEQIKGEDIIYNVCCWAFPGEWVVDVADSWRTGNDISADFGSVLYQLDAVANLAEYHGPGHVHDMDMLQVGRGMTFEEDKSHFGMWCMLSVPLILGHDVTQTTEETMEIITNEELIAINQDPAVIMAQPVRTTDGVQLWSKPLGSKDSNEKAIALLNRNNHTTVASVNWSEVGFTGDVQVRDLWAHEDLVVGDSYTVTIPAHGCVILKVTGDAETSNAVMKSFVTEAPKNVDLAAEGTLDWVDLANGTAKENAYIIDADSDTSVNLKTVSTGRVAKIYVTGKNAVVTATLEGKQTTEAISGSGVYTVEYIAEFGSEDLVITVEGGTINAVAVADAEGGVRADTKLVVSNCAANSDAIAVARPEAESLDNAAFENDNMKGTKKGLLTDYVTAVGAEVTLNRDKFPTQSHLSDYFELYLPATDELTRAVVTYGVRYGTATVTVENGDQTEQFKVYDVDGSGVTQDLSIWYTASSDVTVTITLDSVFSSDAEVFLAATDLMPSTDILTRPKMTQKANQITGTAYAETADPDSVLAINLYSSDGTKLDSITNPIERSGIQDLSLELPKDVTSGYFTVAISNGAKLTTEAYKFAFPIVDEHVPEEQPKIGNLQAKELVKNGAVLLDVRSAEEYEADHIDGAININYLDILTKAEDILTDKDANIVVYCSAGKRSTQAQMALIGLGYTHVYNIGAMSNWYIEPSITISVSDGIMKAGDKIVVMADANPYETDLKLYYAFGEDATLKDAALVPADHMVTLGEEGYIKAWLTFGGEIVATEECETLLLEPIPQWNVDAYMSDLNWSVNDSYWKPANKNKSIDGNNLKIVGNAFTKGIGAHAWSTIVAEIPEGMNRFVAVAGMDDEVSAQIAGGYKVQYAVYIDDVLMEKSMELPIGYYHVFDVPFPVGSKEIRLEIYNTPDGTYYDHADWGIAGFMKVDESDYHTITVTDGTASAKTALWGQTITLTADKAPEGQTFEKWVGDVEFADETATTTTFTMPNSEVSVTAVYRYLASKGDVDKSGTIDVADIMKMKSLIMSEKCNEEELALGDMDGSGKLDVADIMSIKKIIMSA